MFLDSSNQEGGLSWELFINNKKTVIGRSTLQPDAEMFLHKHKIVEYYYILNGKATMQLGKKQLILKKNMFVNIPKFTYHYTKNNFSQPMVFLYFFNEGPFEEIDYLK